MKNTSNKSSAALLPTEILLIVYQLLAPQDFNAARHVCRQWMMASIDLDLLCVMLKRGGWWHSVYTGATDQLLDSWLLSCHLARECALSAGWKGNGILGVDDFPLEQTTHVDFSDLAAGTPGIGGQSGGLTLTASICGRHLLAAEGILIYVYELGKHDIRPLSTIVCPARVLAVAMDTTARRHAVAALLDNRVGFLCNLHAGREQSELLSVGSQQTHQSSPTQSSVGTVKPLQSTFSSRLLPEASEYLAADMISQQITASLVMTAEDENLDGEMKLGYCDKTGNTVLNTAAPPTSIEYGPFSLYRHLCSANDPPRSVAICPQRQCVAFGCGAGVELHWVDALTGQDLNRWFPLTGPSDHLYFLPQRRVVDSGRTLRLISSAAHPTSRTAIARKFFAPKRGLVTPGLRSFTRNIGIAPVGLASPLQIRSDLAHGQTTVVGDFIADCDHFRAVPMSDGFHIVFLDPDTCLLCIGSDAPAGSPRRLLRKILLLPPSSHDLEGVIPRLYAVTNADHSASLTRSPRVIAVYGDLLVLFSIPIDVLKWSSQEQDLMITGNRINFPGVVSEAAQWWDWWSDDDILRRTLAQPVSRSIDTTIWPLFLNGIVVGRMSNLVDVAINEERGLYIWAFALNGMATVWNVKIGTNSTFDREKDVVPDEGTTAAETALSQDSHDSDFPPSQADQNGEDTIHIGGHGI